MIFESINKTEHEEVVFCHNKDVGLKAIIAIHNTVLGPALGGTRMWPYATEQDALNDVLRLAPQPCPYLLLVFGGDETMADRILSCEGRLLEQKGELVRDVREATSRRYQGFAPRSSDRIG